MAAFDNEDTSIFELRLYEVASGRLAPEIARMHDVAIAGEPLKPGGPPVRDPSVFDRHGIPKPLGAWTAVSGSRLPLFGYLLRWDSLAQRDACFPSFWADPLWRDIHRETDDGSPIVERAEDWLLRPSACSASVVPDDDNGIEALPYTEMLIQRVENGYLQVATSTHAKIRLPLLAAHGAVTLGVFDMVIGTDMPATVTFLGWANQPTQEAAWQALHLDQGMRAAIREERATFGRTLVRSEEHVLMKPVHYGSPSTRFGRVAA